MKFLSFSSLISIIAGRSTPDKFLPRKTQVTPLFHPNYVQLSSTVSQINGAIGVGIPIEYNSEDAKLGVDFDAVNPSVIVTNVKSAYFVFAAPQVGVTDPSGIPNIIADYYMRKDGIDINNSGVRYTSSKDDKDVIVSQSVILFDEGNQFEFVGSGANSQTEAIVEAGEPLIPGILLTLFELSLPVYIQLSSTLTQINGAIGTGVALSFDSVDVQDGLALDPVDNTQIVVPEDGAYFIVAAPEVAGTNTANPATADYWLKVNGIDLPDSNVRWVGEGTDEDVIVCQGVFELNAGDVVQVFGSGENSENKAIAPIGEPFVPSVLFSMFKLFGSAYLQLSSTETQPNGALGTGVAINFDTSGARFGITWETLNPSEIVAEASGSYFMIAAPQVGAIDKSIAQIADYWIKVNGADVTNSNVRYQNAGGDTDVIVSQGVYELNKGDRIQVFGSGVNSASEAIEVTDEPLVPSIIFSMFLL